MLSQNVLYELVIAPCGRLHSVHLGGEVAFHKVTHPHALSRRVCQGIQVIAYLLLQFPEGKAWFLALWQFVGRFKPPTVYELRFAFHMVFELILSVCSDGFSTAEKSNPSIYILKLIQNPLGPSVIFYYSYTSIMIETLPTKVKNKFRYTHLIRTIANIAMVYLSSSARFDSNDLT